MNIADHLKNRQAFPIDTLLQYAGKYIAWSPDGTKVVASADDLIGLDNAVKASGYPVEECVVSAVPAADGVIGGGVVA